MLAAAIIGFRLEERGVRSTSWKYWLAVLPITACVGGAAVVIVAAGTSSKSSETNPAAIRARFGLFRQAAPGAETVRQSLAGNLRLARLLRHLGEAKGNSLALDAAATRFVHTAEGTVWVIPGRNGACVGVNAPTTRAVLSGGPVTCGRLTQRYGYRLGDVVPETDNPRVGIFYGIVPDGVTGVVVTFPSGRTTTVPAVDNAYIVRAPITVTADHKSPAGALKVTWGDQMRFTSTPLAR